MSPPPPIATTPDAIKVADSRQPAATSWALIDQALVSGTNFSVGILLARLLGPSGFGLYTILWTICICANLLQWGLIITPLQSIGSKRILSEKRFYLSAVFAQQLGFSLLCSLFFFAGILAFYAAYPGYQLQDKSTESLAAVALPAALSMGLSQTQDFFRRYFMIRGTPRVAYLSDWARYGTYLACLGAFYYLNDRTIHHVFWAMSGASLIGTLVSLPHISVVRPARRMLSAVTRRHFAFAKWLIPATALQWVNANIHFYATAFFMGQASVGALKASQNVMSFTAVVVEGLENSVPSHAAKRLASDGREGLSAYLRRTARQSIGLLFLVVGGIALAPDFFMHLLFGDRFSGNGRLVIGFGVVSLLHISGYFVNVFIRATERTVLIFRTDLIVTAWALLSAPFLVRNFGLMGAVFGLAMCHLIRLTSLAISVRRLIPVQENSQQDSLKGAGNTSRPMSTPTSLTRLPETTPRHLGPNLFIVGAAKSGTSTLARVLRDHPDIYFPNNSLYKEPSYFSHWRSGLDKESYFGLYSGSDVPKKYRGDASTAYLTDPASANRIHEYNTNSKIIILLRNPVERAYSLYNWMVQEGHEYSPTFEFALEMEPRRKQKKIPNLLEPEYYYDYLYYESGLYLNQVKAYASLFPRSQMMVDLFENLAENPAAFLSRLCVFLDVENPGFSKVPKENPSRQVLHPFLTFSMRYIIRLLWLGRIPRSKEQRDSMIKRLWLRKDPRRMKPATRQELLRRYQPEFVGLQREFGLDLTKWQK